MGNQETEELGGDGQPSQNKSSVQRWQGRAWCTGGQRGGKDGEERGWRGPLWYRLKALGD